MGSHIILIVRALPTVPPLQALVAVEYISHKFGPFAQDQLPPSMLANVRLRSSFANRIAPLSPLRGRSTSEFSMRLRNALTYTTSHVLASR